MGGLRPVPTFSVGLATSQVYYEVLGSSRAVKVHRLRRWRRSAVDEATRHVAQLAQRYADTAPHSSLKMPSLWSSDKSRLRGLTRRFIAKRASREYRDNIIER